MRNCMWFCKTNGMVGIAHSLSEWLPI
jgi:hypothetical protein